MSDVINIKDFYNHETRISIVENAIVHIDKRFEHIDKRFEQIDKRFEKVNDEIKEVKFESRSHFRWMMGFLLLQLSATIGMYANIISKLH